MKYQAHIAWIGMLVSLQACANDRPADLPSSIECLNNRQAAELIEKYKPIIKQGGDAEFSLSVLLKAGYLADERALHIERMKLSACQASLKDSSEKPICSDAIVKHLEKNIEFENESEARPASEPNKLKMKMVLDRMREIRSEYPKCE